MRRSLVWFGLRAGVVLLVGAVLYGAWLDIHVRAQFEGKRWALPAVLYARALDVYPGLWLSPDVLEEELLASGFSASQQLGRPGTFRRGVSSISLRTRAFDFWDGPEPARTLTVGFDGSEVNRLVDRSGPVSIFRLEPAEIGRIYPLHDEDRVLIRLQDAPKSLIEALLVSEDRSFWSHYGVSPRSLLRAVWANVRAGRTVQGGSTLTQQLAKNFFLTPERTLIRKLREAAIALILEARYGKEEILEAYLNEVFLGQQGRRAIHGFGLAARYYFGRPLDELRLAENALLVALIRGASYYDPRRHPQRALDRRNLVLEQMAAHGLLSQSEADAASQSPLGVTRNPGSSSSAHPAFLDLVRRQLRRDYRDDDLRAEGLRVFTTLAPRAQRQAEITLREGIGKLERTRRLTGLQGATIVTAVESGEILAVVGGRDPRGVGFNRALDAVRPIGSLVKPAVYLAAIDEAGGYHLASMLNDEAVSVDGPNGAWEPSNYDGKMHGQIPLYLALAKSYNLATVRLGMSVGLSRVSQNLRQLGIKRRIPPYPSTLLGSLELSPLDVSQMYQTLAAGGFRVPLRAIREVVDAQNRTLSRYPLSGTQAVSPEAAYQIRAGLERVVQEGTAKYARTRLPAELRPAGKTGTTDELRDSWFAGFAGNRLAVVWVGRDDNRPAGLTGSSGALRVWTELLSGLRPGPGAPPKPTGIDEVYVSPATGLQVGDDCEGAVRLPFLRDRMPAPGPCEAGDGEPLPVWLPRPEVPRYEDDRQEERG